MNWALIEVYFYQKKVMKNKYLTLTVIGTLLPNIFVFMEGLTSGNWTLYRFPLDTFKGMFANYISSAFITDLLFLVILFMLWSWVEGKKEGMSTSKTLLVWGYTFLLGLAGGLPLFLYLREVQKEQTTTLGSPN